MFYFKAFVTFNIDGFSMPAEDPDDVNEERVEDSECIPYASRCKTPCARFNYDARRLCQVTNATTTFFCYCDIFGTGTTLKGSTAPTRPTIPTPKNSSTRATVPTATTANATNCQKLVRDPCIARCQLYNFNSTRSCLMSTGVVCNCGSLGTPTTLKP